MTTHGTGRHGIPGSRTPGGPRGPTGARPPTYATPRRSAPLRTTTVYTAAQLLTPQVIATIENNGSLHAEKLGEYVEHVRALCAVTPDMPAERVRHIVPSLASIVDHLADMGIERYRTWWRPRSAAQRNEPRRMVADDVGDAFA